MPVQHSISSLRQLSAQSLERSQQRRVVARQAQRRKQRWYRLALGAFVVFSQLSGHAAPVDDSGATTPPIVVPSVQQQIPVPAVALPRSVVVVLTDRQGEQLPYGMQTVRAAGRYGIRPALFLALVEQESGGHVTTVSSHVGARGLTQLMPETARELGLIVTNRVDERTDPIKALDAGARYLSQQLQTFQREELALAAYNAGAGNVRRYGGVPPYKETQTYVQAIERYAARYETQLQVRESRSPTTRGR
jgi:soluble lytic murein transglycosylase-like protein